MFKRFVSGAIIALGSVSAAFAQYSAPAPASGSMTPKAAMPNDMLKMHLTAGAQIYDSKGKVVGSVTTVKDDGSILIREASVGGGPTPPVDRVLPASSVSWTNNKLVTTLSAEAIAKLPTSS
jgi:hypothetical protein